MTGNPFFGILTIVSLIVFGLGVAGNVFFWLQGHSAVDKGVQASTLTRLLHLVIAALVGLSRAAVWRSLFVDSLLQGRLWRLSRLRWLMQVGFIWGTIELFFVGSLGNMLAEKGLVSLTKDTPAFALLNELGALLILTSVALALYRRFVAREHTLPTSGGDAVLVVLLATIVISGIFLESARLLAGSMGEGAGWYSFLGYGLALVAQPLVADWSGIYSLLWWFHIIVSFGLVAYLPFSKLFHLFVGPAVLAAGAAER